MREKKRVAASKVQNPEPRYSPHSITPESLFSKLSPEDWPGTLMEVVLGVCGSCALSSPVARDTSVLLCLETFGFQIMRSLREGIVSNWQLQPADQIDNTNSNQPHRNSIEVSKQVQSPRVFFLSPPIAKTQERCGR